MRLRVPVQQQRRTVTAVHALMVIPFTASRLCEKPENSGSAESRVMLRLQLGQPSTTCHCPPRMPAMGSTLSSVNAGIPGKVTAASKSASGGHPWGDECRTLGLRIWGGMRYPRGFMCEWRLD